MKPTAIICLLLIAAMVSAATVTIDSVSYSPTTITEGTSTTLTIVTKETSSTGNASVDLVVVLSAGLRFSDTQLTTASRSFTIGSGQTNTQTFSIDATGSGSQTITTTLSSSATVSNGNDQQTPCVKPSSCTLGLDGSASSYNVTSGGSFSISASVTSCVCNYEATNVNVTISSVISEPTPTKTIGSVTSTSAPSPWSYTAGSSGSYNFTLTARSSNANSATTNVIVEVLTPSGGIAPVDLSSYACSATNETLRLNATYAASAYNASVSYGTTTALGTSAWNTTQASYVAWTLTGLSASTKYYFNFTDYNSTGASKTNGTYNCTTSSNTDTANPTVSIQRPAAGSYYNSAPTLNFTASDDFSVDKCWYSLDNWATNNTLAGCANGSISGSSEGNNSLRLAANDTSGRRNDTASVTYLYDITNPQVTINSPANITYNRTWVELNTTITDTNLNTTECYYTLNNFTSNQSYNCSYINITGFAQGNNTHALKVIAKDRAGNRNTTEQASFTTYEAITDTGGGGGSGGSGGGSGGSGGAPAPSAGTAVTESKTLPKIVAGIPLAAVFTKTDLAVTGIELTVNGNATAVTLTVQKEDKKPATVTDAISTAKGKVYKYITITLKNLDTSKLDQAKIKFNVSRAWLTQNNIDPSTISLMRYSNKTWQKLVTIQTRETSTAYYFEAETPGFSVFAITGETKAAAPSTPDAQTPEETQPPAEETKEQGQTVTTPVQQVVTRVQTTVQAAKADKTIIAVALVMFLLVVVIGVEYLHRNGRIGGKQQIR